MRPRDLEAELHPSVRAARDLRALADLWAPLHEALRPSGGGNLETQGRKRGRREGSPMLINGHVSDTIGDITEWAYGWVTRLADETDWTPPDAGIDTRFTYRPPTTDHDGPALKLTIPRALRALADRTGHFTEHPDRVLAEAFVEECHKMRQKAENVVNPDGNRRVPTHMPCLHPDCPGEYAGVVPPDSRYTDIPTLRCTKTREHTITPDELRRIQRWQARGGGHDPSAVRDYLARLRQQQPAHNLYAALRYETTATKIARAARPGRG